MQNPESQSITNDDLKAFLRLQTFGNLQTNASELSSEEESLLIDLLDKLHKQKNLDVKGLWGIISLVFQNRSGLVLMTMFNNLSSNLIDLSKRKNFLKDIQILQNTDVNLDNILRAIQVLGIPRTLFNSKFEESKQQIKKAKQLLSHNRSKYQTNWNRILKVDQYDSDPENHYQMEFQQNLNNDWRNFSLMQINKNLIQSSEQQQNIQQTISIKRRVNTKQRNHTLVSRRNKKKRSKRPKYKERKKVYKTQMKNKNVQQVNFVSNRRQKNKLKNTYNLIMKINNQEGVTPIKKGKIQQSIRSTQKNVRKSYRNYDQLQQQDDQNEEQYQQDSYQQGVIVMQAYREQNLHQNRSSRNLRQYSILQSQQQNSMIDEALQYSLQNQLINFNENRQNLQVKQIKFPLTYRQILELKVVCEKDHYEFNQMQWQEYLKTLTQKQELNLVKKFVRQKNDTEAQSIVKLIFTLKNARFSRYEKTHLNPILTYKFTCLLSQIINQTINILYTSVLANNQNQSQICVQNNHLLAKALKQIILLNPKSFDQNYTNEQGQKIFNVLATMLYKSLSEIISDFVCREKQTDSMVDFPRPSVTIKKDIRIKMQEEDLNQSIMISIFILTNQFLIKFLHVSTQTTEIVNLNKKMLLFLQTQVSQKSRFLKQIYGIYKCFKLPLKQKVQFETALSFMKQLKQNQVQPLYVSEFIPNLVRQMICQKIQSKQFSHKHVLSRIMTDDVVQKFLNSHDQLGSHITIQTFSAIMQFDNFHNEITIKQMIPYIKKFDMTQKYDINYFSQLLKLMVKFYVIQNKNHKNSASNLLSEFQKFINAFCSKLANVSMSRFEQSPHIIEKCRKYQNIIQLFLDQFIRHNQLSQSVDHYLTCLDLFLAQIIPLIIKLSQQSSNLKQNSFVINLSQSFIEHMYAIQPIFNRHCNQIGNQNSDINMMDEQERMFFYFQLNKLKKQQADKFVKRIEQIILKRLQRFRTQISMTDMRTAKHNTFYQIQGILSSLIIFRGKYDQNLLKELSSHTKQIKFLNNKSTNKSIVQFIKGLFKILYIFSELSFQYRRLEGSVVITTLDILFLTLGCQKQSKATLQLIKMAKKIAPSEPHLLTKFYKQYKDEERQAYASELQMYYKIIQKKILDRSQKIEPHILQKLKNRYFEVLKVFWKQCQRLKFRKQEQILQLNILISFVFILKTNLSVQAINYYKPYFIMTDSKMDKQTNNILKSLQAKPQVHSYQPHIMQMFRSAYDLKRVEFGKTKQYYLDMISNCNYSPQNDIIANNNSIQGMISKVKNTVAALSSQAVTKEDQNGCLCLDNFTYQTCEYLLNSMISKSMLIQMSKQRVVQLFFGLFKKYSNLNEVLVKVLKNNAERLDKMIRDRSLKNFDYLEDAIRKEVLTQFCQFKLLHSVLWFRMCKRMSNDKQTNRLKQIKQIIKICIGLIQNKVNIKAVTICNMDDSNENLSRNGFMSDTKYELLQKYRNLLDSTQQKLQQLSDNYNKFSFFQSLNTQM